MTERPEDTIQTTESERREQDRERLEGLVRVRIRGETLEGRGQNVSQGGVLLNCSRGLEVEVELDDGEMRIGEVVRLQANGDGSFAVAVRFRDDG